jgi:hypothetical protein
MIDGLIHFLNNNPFAFSFVCMEKPRGEYGDWKRYHEDVYLKRKEWNDNQRKKGRKVDEGPIFLHKVSFNGIASQNGTFSCTCIHSGYCSCPVAHFSVSL